MHPGLLKCSHLVNCLALASRDDGSSVAHASARRGSLARDEADYREVPVVVVSYPVSRLFLSFSADLAYDDDALGLLICHEPVKHIDEVCAVKGVSSDTDYRGLSEPNVGCLQHCLVGQGA